MRRTLPPLRTALRRPLVGLASGDESSGEPEEEDDIYEEGNFVYIVSDDDDREVENTTV